MQQIERKKCFGGAASLSKSVIWLWPDGKSEPYQHNTEGECDCETCASKPRLIIYPVAA